MDERTAELIERLALQLGTTAEHLWSVLVVQARVVAVQDIVTGLLLCVGLWFGVRAARWLWAEIRRERGAYDDPMGYVLGFICLLIGEAVTGVFTISLFVEASTCAVNPEYWALRQVLSALSQKTN
jgi:hypothetical protein